jgi:Tol biopolymer transport system component
MGTRTGGAAGSGSGEPTFATLSAGVDDAWEANGDAFAVSPNGRLIVVRSRRDSGTTLVLQSLDSVASRVLPNTGGATYPFFSPDNRSLAFFADGSLRVMDLASGAVITRCPAPRPSGGSWGADGVILYVPVSGESLYQTSALDGPCTKLAVRIPPGSGWPRFLPDGRTFVFAMGTGSYIGALGEDSLTLLVENPARAVVAGDELLYRNGADGMLVARHIDVAKRVLDGPATPVLAGVATPFSNTTVAASPAGTVVAYARPRRREGSSSMLVHMAPGDRVASATRNNGNWSVPELSANGGQVAMGGFTLELFDVARGEWRELVPRRTGGNLAAAGIAWLPGDSLVAFTRVVNPQVPESIQVAHVATGAVQGLAAVPERNRRLRLSRWTADGRLLAVGLSSGDTSPWDEAWVYDAGTRAFTRAFAEAKHVRSPELSPDGRWLAYQVVEPNGRAALFVRPYPGPGVPVPVTRGDVDRPRWSRDGRTLYFVRGERQIEGVTVAADGQVGEPRVAVSAAVLAGVRDDYGMVQFSVGREPGEFWLLLNEYRANSLILLQNLPGLLVRRRAGAPAP